MRLPALLSHPRNALLGGAALALLSSVGCHEAPFRPDGDEGCTRAAVYWRDNVSAWKHLDLRMGGTHYAQEEQVGILQTRPQGNGLISLSQQLIAARLNVRAGADASGMERTFAAADALIGAQVVPPRGDGYRAPSETVRVTEELLAFNEGQVGPGACPDLGPTD